MKVTKKNVSTVSYLDGGQRESEMTQIQIVWEPGVEVDRIISKGVVQLV